MFAKPCSSATSSCGSPFFRRRTRIAVIAGFNLLDPLWKTHVIAIIVVDPSNNVKYYTKRNTEYGIRNTEYEIWNTKFRIRNAEYGIQNTEYRLQNTECGIQNAKLNQYVLAFGNLFLRFLFVEMDAPISLKHIILILRDAATYHVFVMNKFRFLNYLYHVAGRTFCLVMRTTFFLK